MEKNTNQDQAVNEVDPIAEAKNALRVYAEMEHSLKGFQHLLDYHKKTTEEFIKRKLKEDEKAKQ